MDQPSTYSGKLLRSPQPRQTPDQHTGQNHQLRGVPATDQAIRAPRPRTGTAQATRMTRPPEYDQVARWMR